MPDLRNPTGKSDEMLILTWDRDAKRQPVADLPLPNLTSIMVSLNRDTGFRVRPGYTISAGGERERPKRIAVVRDQHIRRTYAAEWRMQVKTSTKRELMETHLPLVLGRFGEGAEMRELEKRIGEKGPFAFKVRKVGSDVTEDTFVTAVLASSAGLDVTLQSNDLDELVALRGRRRGGGLASPYAVMSVSAGPFDPLSTSTK